MKTITVAAPLCSPARYWQAKTHERLAEYGAEGAGLHVSAHQHEKESIHIDVRVSDDYAEFCEYLLYCMAYEPVSRPLNPKNLEYAHKRLFPDQQAKRWYEPSCHDKPKTGALIGELPQANPPPSWKSQGKLYGRGGPQSTTKTKRRRKPTPSGRGGLGGLLRELLP